MRNLILLDSHKRAVCMLSNKLPNALPFIDDLLEKDLDNYTDKLTLSVPLVNEKAKLIAEDMYILYPTNYDKYCLYRIKYLTEESSDKHVLNLECEISAQTDLLSNLVAPTTFSEVGVTEVLKYILRDTGLQVGDVEDFGLITYDIPSYMTKQKAIVDLCEQLDAEMNFSYVVRGAVIIEEKVNIIRELGNGEICKLFIKERDLNVMTKKVDTSKLITGIIGAGKKDAEGKMVSYADFDVSLPSGYKKEGDLIYSVQALENYGINGNHIIGVNADENATSAVELAENSLKILQQYEKPIYTYEAKVVYLKEKLEDEGIVFDLGDKIFLQDETMSSPLILQARIRKIVTSICNPEKDEITFGDYIRIKERDVSAIEIIQDTLRDYEALWNAGRWNLEIQSTGGNIFIDGVGETVLTAYVTKNGIAFDEAGTLLKYTWTRKDKNGLDLVFSNGEMEYIGKSIIVNAQDYDIKATYNVKVEVDNDLI